MRVKTLLLIGALVVASSAATPVCSAAVGYVNVELNKGFTIVANPLNADDNHLSYIFPSNLPSGTTVYRYSDGAFMISTFAPDDTNVLSWDNDFEMKPGEGFFIKNPAQTNVVVTFVGEVMQSATNGPLANPLVAGFNLKGSMFPQSGDLEYDLGYAAEDGDVVYRLVNGSYEISTYGPDDHGNLNWDTVPTPAVGEGFWIKSKTAKTWIQTFTMFGPAGMVFISAGSFTMGSPTSETDQRSDELQHTVTISHGFWMSKYETTQWEYLAVMGNNPSYFTGDLQRPVEQVSWQYATNFCGKLTQLKRSAGLLPSGYVYRLPTEAEWEYACRAGMTTATTYGNSLRSTQANFDGDYPYGGAAKEPFTEITTKAGSYAPNAWGLYDMHGNVSEWCLDWYGPYSGGSVTDPKGPASGSFRVFRGGSWSSIGSNCRTAYRDYDWPILRDSNVGFRPVLALGQ